MTSTTLTPQRPRAFWLLADAAVLTGRAVRHTVRQIDGLLLSVMLPVMLLLMFTYVFGGAINTGTDYLNYVVPGVIILAAGYGASLIATSVAQVMTTGTIDRFRSMPMSVASLLTGHVASAVLRTLFSTLLVIAVALVMGFRPTTNPVAWLGVLGVTSLFVLAVAWVSVAIGVMAKSVDAEAGTLSLPLYETDQLRGVLNRFAAASVKVTDVRLSEPTLDDVFFAVTGTAETVTPELEEAR